MNSFNSVVNIILENKEDIVFSKTHEDSIDYVSGDSADIDYFGFRKKMSPQEFRSLVPPGNSDRTSVKQFEERLERGGVIYLAPPLLKVRWNEDAQEWDVFDHEGRSRMDFAMAHGVQSVLVDIIPSGGMRSHMINDYMKEAPFNPQPYESEEEQKKWMDDWKRKRRGSEMKLTRREPTIEDEADSGIQI